MAHLAKHMEHISLPIIYLVEAQKVRPETIASVQDHPQKAPFREREQPPSHPRSAVASLPTDSGYASVPKPKNPNPSREEPLDDPFDDNATIRTDRQELLLPPSQKSTYIEKFADLLHGVIPLDDSREIWLERSLTPLLRTFAIRLSSTATEPETKDISTFVRHYRNSEVETAHSQRNLPRWLFVSGF
ncbi:hypothetical protein LZ32DRAFT_330992 [Colletotrichum eremochloae]|nr:hypothetical protein LZ32DRAFT_330992 [Colletotrichum eremochloae]